MRSLAALAALLLVGATPSPRQIFDGTFARLQSYPVPPYAVWTDTWKVLASSTQAVGSDQAYAMLLRYAIRTSDGQENASSFPEKNELPPALVVHLFQGPFAWSVRTERRSPHGGGLQPDIPEPIKTIAHVVTYAAPNYDIELAGLETVNGMQTYHLRLRPLSHSGVHNLRDLWVDARTFDL